MTTKIYFNLSIVRFPRGEGRLFKQFLFAANTGFPPPSAKRQHQMGTHFTLKLRFLKLKEEPKAPVRQEHLEARTLSFSIRNTVAGLLQQTGDQIMKVLPTIARRGARLIRLLRDFYCIKMTF